MRLFLLIVAAILLSSRSLSVQAQGPGVTSLAVGSGQGQIGVLMAPNVECQGPATITPASQSRLAILDAVNQKIVVVNGAAAEDVPLPPDLVEPTDFIATSRGYVVIGMLGDVVVIDTQGKILARKTVDHNPETGDVRLIPLPSGGLAFEELSGSRTSIGLDTDQIGELIVPGLATAASYTRTLVSPTEVVLNTEAMLGPLASVTLTSSTTITDARALWADEGGGMLVAVQQSRKLPEESSFVWLVAFDATGHSKGEAYIAPEAFACGTKRPFARLTNGSVVSVHFDERGEVSLHIVPFDLPGTAEPKAIKQPSDAAVISDEQNVLTALEQLNGTPTVTGIALSSTSRSHILDRARSALKFRWRLASKNFKHSTIANRCNPPAFIWLRPSRLDRLENQEDHRIPYRWGGWFPTLGQFANDLESGRLAGDVCTCRDADCVSREATGLDCSGFVSYAWATGHYFTTATLPSSNVSTPVLWESVASADIVNKAGSHVRLVERIDTTPNGRLFTVIESASNRSCGGVCRRAYLESDLQRRGYKPFRRVALTN